MNNAHSNNISHNREIDFNNFAKIELEKRLKALRSGVVGETRKKGATIAATGTAAVIAALAPIAIYFIPVAGLGLGITNHAIAGVAGIGAILASKDRKEASRCLAVIYVGPIGSLMAVTGGAVGGVVGGVVGHSVGLVREQILRSQGKHLVDLIEYETVEGGKTMSDLVNQILEHHPELSRKQIKMCNDIISEDTGETLQQLYNNQSNSHQITTSSRGPALNTSPSNERHASNSRNNNNSSLNAPNLPGEQNPYPSRFEAPPPSYAESTSASSEPAPPSYQSFMTNQNRNIR
jgi:hypothetical protein